MTKVRCGYTSCKNNKKDKNGYVCKLNSIHLVSYWDSTLRDIGTQMRCEMFTKRKDYAE